ncbi:hypothetical protein DSO57_1004675 [Entomophthora muscae]|uniref:Uncharacterized protein n=1 Tax=Entomophthora muscae TaxID=34485 RepID=A0ACC2U6N3_9FUNG|nr:hypothetical protein DSO57_1004675 [Entomophthora muscae]
MQFTSTLLKITAIASVVVAESEFCNVNHSGPKQHCSVQFKTDAESLGKFAEVAARLRALKCSWMAPGDIVANESAGFVSSDLPVGFVDLVFSKLPQYLPYVASKNCN